MLPTKFYFLIFLFQVCFTQSSSNKVSFDKKVDVEAEYENIGNETESKVFGLSSDPDDVEFHLYTKNPLRYYKLDFNKDESLHNSPITRGKQVIIISHGFTGSGKAESVQLVKNEYLRAKFPNVIVLDWSKASTTKILPLELASYPAVVRLLKVIGTRVGEMITKLILLGIAKGVNSFHLVGFSLGAHVVGIAGLKVFKDLGEKVARITGLDPAGPLFEHSKDNALKLSPDDAKFVDAVHTDIYKFGIYRPVGTVDFYIDGGWYVCVGVSCSHSKAYKIFSESIVKSNHKYFGYPCDIKKSMIILTGCIRNEKYYHPNYMPTFGQWVEQVARGSYRVDT